MSRTLRDLDREPGHEPPPSVVERASAPGSAENIDQALYARLREQRPLGSAVPDPQPGLGPSSPQGMLSPEAAATAQLAFDRLADTLIARAAGERSIEEIARDLLRPMLKQWLDENLPGLVERLVREEIERVARRGGR